MAISRMQEPRQLYGLGSLVRKITRPIKKAVKGVRKIAKSPIGRLAILGGLGAYAGGLGPFSQTGRFAGLRGAGFLRNMFAAPSLKGVDIGFQEALRKQTPSFFSTLNPFGQNFSLKNLGITAGAAGFLLPYVAPNLLAPKEEEVLEDIDYTIQPEGIASIVEQAKDYYRTGGGGNLDYMPRSDFVSRNFYAAQGGLANEEDDEEFDRNLTGIMRTRKQKGGTVPGSTVPGYTTPAGYNKFDYRTGGIPVRTPKKVGGLMDLGGKEMDLRASGGFVPIGSKEKADDVPARLSKNEFVMTADAVRGAGNGSIERGAQKMYNTMKQLENRVA